MNKTFVDRPPKSAHGYSGFPLDHLVNFTSCVGYLIPVFQQILEPGDKVKIKTLLRTRTQPMASPAMATIIERVEWFAVPIEQLDKAFSSKFFGINDVESDLYPTTFSTSYLPSINTENLNNWLLSLPYSMPSQGGVPLTQPTFSEAKRLMDALGYPQGLGSAASVGTTTWQHSVLAYFPAAYQKIYYDHYRLTDRIANDPEAYNLDSFYNTPFITNTSRFNKLFMLHKRPYNLDYFTSMDVSPLFGSASVNAVGLDLGQVEQWLTGLSKVSTAVPMSYSNLPDGGGVVSSNADPSATKIQFGTGTGNAQINYVNQALGAINPSNIRSMFAVEKLLEVTRKTKKHYDKQVLAHFGVDVPKGRSGECFKIGTHEQYIQIGDVVATANTVDTSDNVITGLGELGGRGSSKSASKTLSFEAKSHCILMGIYSAEPLMNYPNMGLNRLNTMTHTTNWYKSEFDSLGQQPIFGYELYDYTYDPSLSSGSDNVIGWQDRYSQLKAAYNRSFAGANTQFFREWFLNRNIYPNVLNNYFFEVWPTDLNTILVDSYTGSVSDPSLAPFQNLVVYAHDYLINQLYCDVTKVSKKSIHGTPNM